MNGGDLASLAGLMAHESVETTKSFYAVFEQEDLRRKHDHFSAARWAELRWRFNLFQRKTTPHFCGKLFFLCAFCRKLMARGGFEPPTKGL
jgi:hypothetical protein